MKIYTAYKSGHGNMDTVYCSYGVLFMVFNVTPNLVGTEGIIFGTPAHIILPTSKIIAYIVNYNLDLLGCKYEEG